MINKTWLILIAALISAFIIVTIVKNRDKGNSRPSDNSIENPQLVHNKEFWSLYREATAFRINSEWSKAIERYEEALGINPEHEDALYYLGNMFLESGNRQEAEATWLHLVRLNNHSARAHYQLGYLYMQPASNELFDLGKAVSELKKALAINPDFIQPLIHLGQISLYQGNVTQSMEYFSTVLGTDPENDISNFLSGYIFWKKGNDSKALEYFTTAYKLVTSEISEADFSNEGDTFEGESMERHINQSLFHSYLIDLSGLPGNNPPEEMASLYSRIAIFLERRN